MLLEIESIDVHYSGLWALRGISIQVNEGEIVSIFGANGAGKSTLLSAISGIVSPDSGRILVNGETVNGFAPEKIVRLGIAHVPEGRHLFGSLSVEENLLMGAYLIKDRREVAKSLQEAYSLFPQLKILRRQRAETMSGGEQQMLAICRGLMCRPKLLLLDEPTLGLAPLLIREIGQAIVKLHQTGMAIILAEQNARFAFALASRGYLLERGKVVLHDRVETLRQNERVRMAYLGG